MKMDIGKVKDKYKLTSSEQVVYDCITDNVEDVIELGIKNLAKKCFCSTSVVLNLSKKMGYIGFKDMIYSLRAEIKFNKNLTKDNEIYFKKFTNFEEESKNKFIELLILHRKDAIYINGSGFSFPICLYLQKKLMLLGFYSFLFEHFENIETPHTKNPLYIFVSRSGESVSISNFIKSCQKKKYTVVSFTNQNTNTLRSISDLNFSILDNATFDDSNVISNSFFPGVLFLFEYLLGLYQDKISETF